MAKYRKKLVIIETTQWFKNGDHPEDRMPVDAPDPYDMEGKVVRYYRHPDIDGKTACKHCNVLMERHGWIDTLEGGHVVCPEDWIITGIKGERYPVKPDIFEQLYEKVED